MEATFMGEKTPFSSLAAAQGDQHGNTAPPGPNSSLTRARVNLLTSPSSELVVLVLATGLSNLQCSCWTQIPGLHPVRLKCSRAAWNLQLLVPQLLGEDSRNHHHADALFNHYQNTGFMTNPQFFFWFCFVFVYENRGSSCGTAYQECMHTVSEVTIYWELRQEGGTQGQW